MTVCVPSKRLSSTALIETVVLKAPAGMMAKAGKVASEGSLLASCTVSGFDVDAPLRVMVRTAAPAPAASEMLDLSKLRVIFPAKETVTRNCCWEKAPSSSVIRAVAV